MKLIVKFFSFILVLGIAGLFFIKKPDGSPWLSINDLIPNISTKELKSTIDNALPKQVVGGTDEKVAVYRWKDAEGNWQFSDSPPDHQNAEQVLVSTHLNKDLAPELKKMADGIKAASGKAYLIKDSSNEVDTSRTPANIDKLINDAKNVQQIMDDRQKQLDALEGQ